MVLGGGGYLFIDGKLSWSFAFAKLKPGFPTKQLKSLLHAGGLPVVLHGFAEGTSLLNDHCGAAELQARSPQKGRGELKHLAGTARQVQIS